MKKNEQFENAICCMRLPSERVTWGFANALQKAWNRSTPFPNFFLQTLQVMVFCGQ